MPESAALPRPIDGRYRASDDEMRAACVRAGHPKSLLNLSVSAKCGREVWRCLCGVVDDSGEALRERARVMRRRRGAEVRHGA
jgi:hypothetical protein